jgi:hypothetical protein
VILKNNQSIYSPELAFSRFPKVALCRTKSKVLSCGPPDPGEKSFLASFSELSSCFSPDHLPTLAVSCALHICFYLEGLAHTVFCFPLRLSSSSFHQLHFFLCPSQITSSVRLLLTVLLKVKAISILFPFLRLYFLLNICIPNIRPHICFFNCLPGTGVLAPWVLGLCRTHCCFLSNQNNAWPVVNM